MNDDLMTQLDQRGRAAAAGLHAAVAERPVPEFDPDLVRVALDDDPAGGPALPGAPRGRRWVAVLGIAAALLVVALGAALASQAGDDDGAPIDQVGTIDQVRPYVAGWLPEGFEIVQASDGSRSTMELPAIRLELYGPSVDDPRVGIASMVGGTPIAEQLAEGDQSLRSIGTAAGREVFAQDEQPGTFAFEEGDVQVVIFPEAGTDESTVLDLAAVVELDGDEVGLADPPEDWERLGPVADPWVALSAAAGMVETGAHYAAYSGPEVETADEETTAGVVVSSSPGTALDVSAVRLFAPGAEEVVVRGHPGLIADLATGGDEADEQWMITWEERPGEVVRVLSGGLGRDDVLAVADEVRAVSDSEWDDMVRSAVITPRPGEQLVGTGEFSDGSPWALVAYDTGEGGWWSELRTSAADDGSYAGSDSGVGQAIGEDGEPVEPVLPALSEVIRSGGGGLAWAYGRLEPTSGAGVARVVVEDASGAEVAQAVLVGEGDLRGWVVEIPPGLIPPEDDDDSASSVGAGSSGSGSSSGSAEGSSGGTETTVLAGGPEDLEGETAGTGGTGGLSVVAYAADGTELARQPLP